MSPYRVNYLVARGFGIQPPNSGRRGRYMPGYRVDLSRELMLSSTALKLRENPVVVAVKIKQPYLSIQKLPFEFVPELFKS